MRAATDGERKLNGKHSDEFRSSKVAQKLSNELQKFELGTLNRNLFAQLTSLRLVGCVGGG